MPLMWGQTTGKKAAKIRPWTDRAKLFRPDKAAIPGQLELLRLFDEEQCKYVAYRGGIGAGKTWIGSHYGVRESGAQSAGARLHRANTFRNFRNQRYRDCMKWRRLTAFRFIRSTGSGSRKETIEIVEPT